MHTNQIVPDLPLLDLGPLDTELQSIPLSGNTPPRAPFVDPGMSPGIVHHPNDGTEDLIIIQLQVKYIAVTLLHQNLTSISVKEMAQPMLALSTRYYNEVGTVITNNYEEDVHLIRTCLNMVCPHDHLFGTTASTNFRLELLTTAAQSQTSLTLDVLKLEVEECLHNTLSDTTSKSPVIFPLLLLEQTAPNTAPTGSVYHATSPALNLALKSLTSGVKSEGSCDLQTGHLSVICDITLFDRLAVLHRRTSKAHVPTVPGQNLHGVPTSSMMRQDIYEQMMDREASPSYDQTFSFWGACSNVTVRLRFPIPDMRPADQRTWWAPALRADYITFHLNDITVDYVTHGAEEKTVLDVEFEKLYCDYHENSDAEPISFLQAGHYAEEGGQVQRLKIHVVIRPSSDSPLNVVNTPSPPPSFDSILQMPAEEPSPFATKKVMYESQELIMPGTQEEMKEFEQSTVSNSHISVSMEIPEVLLYLQSKNFFEVIYNRVFTDLLLWTPGCPAMQESGGAHFRFAEPDVFRMCTSTAHKESDSDDDESEMMFAPKQHVKQDSWLSLSFHISQGRISLTSSVALAPEMSPLHVNPSGEVLIEVFDTNMFTVAGYQGDEDLSFFCLYSEGGSLHHGTCSDMSLSSSTLTASSIGTTLKEILYALPKELSEDLPPPKPGYGFLTLATKIYFDQTKNIKEITLSLALQNVCHRYYMTPQEENFALQIVEFFNVADYEVPGYKLPLSVTSLHTHLWNCAVDYRPLYLPWQMILTIQSLDISSNLALDSSVTLLRFLLEDLCVYVGPSDCDAALNKDYVKLIELDLFELCVRMLVKPHSKMPMLEIDANNNMLHIRTCSDSCAALRDLLIYCTSEGDLHPPGTAYPEEPPAPSTLIGGSSSDDIHSLVKSALRQTSTEEGPPPISLSLKDPPSAPSTYSKQTFSFPDDVSPPTAIPQQTVSALANAFNDDSEDVPIQTPYSNVGSLTCAVQSAMEDIDDEFYVVQSELVETMVAKGQFVIKKLTEEERPLIEDHFSPPDESDQLKAPSHFPTPLTRITIKEISVLWHLYGGNDFPKPATDERTTSNPGTPRSQRYNSESGTRNEVKGEGRRHNEQMEFQINKMKLRIEQYPESATQTLRLCVILSDVEIRDRMGSSNFNKFLYQYSTAENPRPSRTPMVCVKVVHSKSEETIGTEEAVVRVSVLPLRFNIDQDALVFLFSFFTNIGDQPTYKRARSRGNSRCSSARPSTSPSKESLTFGKSQAVVEKTSAHANSIKYVTQTIPEEEQVSQPVEPLEIEESPVFVKAFMFSPEVPIRVDYKGKNLRGDKNMISNPLTNLLIGLAQLNCSELRLRSLCYRQGLLGYPRLAEWVIMQWVNDIKTSQLPSILGGVGPMHSFIQLFSGVVDLVYLPVQQYREDGRIVKGLQRGANSFTHSTAVSLLQLSSKLFYSIQCVAEVTYDLVSPIPHRRSSQSCVQPSDLREGFVNAYETVTTDAYTRASSIQHAALFNHSTQGITAAIGGVMREIPPTLVQPILSAAQGMTQILDGAQNHLRPGHVREREEKYRSNKIEPQ